MHGRQQNLVETQSIVFPARVLYIIQETYTSYRRRKASRLYRLQHCMGDASIASLRV